MCKLHRSIYGLHLSSHTSFHAYLFFQGSTQTKTNFSIYAQHKHNGDIQFMWMIVYVSKNLANIFELKIILLHKFEMVMMKAPFIIVL